MDAAGVGIALQSIELTNVTMPEEVREVYDKVNAATVEASTLLEEAEQYKNTMLPYAEYVANSILSSANSNYASSVSAARSDLAEFWGVLKEYTDTPDVVKTRLYNEKMAKALTKIGQVRLVDDGDSKIFITWSK